MKTRLLVVSGVLLTGGAVAAAEYGFSGSSTCTLQAAQSGVTIRATPGFELPPEWSVSVRASDDWVIAEPLSATARIALVDLPDEGPVALQVQTRDGSGQVVTEQPVSAVAEPYSPNGAGCGPTVGRVDLAVSRSGRVEQAGGVSG